jgi:hypothetical protein
MDGITKPFIVTIVLGAIIYAVVEAYIDAHFFANEGEGVLNNGTNVKPKTSGSSWTNAGYNSDLDMEADTDVYFGPGKQHQRVSFNGQIFAQQFHRGGNPNSQQSGEKSYAFQTATKNPFANGTYNGYQNAVDGATSDPTNNATALVRGPGLAINNDNS